MHLTDDGLQALDALGQVASVVRIGASHGCDDAFYIDRYQTQFYMLASMQDEYEKQADVIMKRGDSLPFAGLAKPFKHLLSAHGEPLLDNAHQAIAQSVERIG